MARKPARKPSRPAERARTRAQRKPVARPRTASSSTPATPRRIQAARRATIAQVDRERERRIAAFREEIARDVRAQRAGRPEPLRILAEGDSWFDYPIWLGTGGGIIDHLSGMIHARILNLAHHGDEVREMMALKQRERIARMLADRTLRFQALLFSGGGNDLVGDHFVLWLKDRGDSTSPLLALDRQRLRDALAIVEMGYRDLIDLRDRLNPRCVIFAHQYDFPQPSDKGVCWQGPWLKPSLDHRGWKDPGQQSEIVREMLVEFASRLQGLERQAGNFHIVRTQGLLDRAKDWHNEIHPNRSGYQILAGAFRDTIRSRLAVHAA